MKNQSKSLKNQHQNLQKQDSDVRMALTGHLSEFRNKLVISAIVFVIFAVISFYFVKPLVDELKSMAELEGWVFVAVGFTEQFMVMIKISLLAGLILASPVILLNIWSYVKPALKPNEKKTLAFALTSGTGFFAAGALFCYFFVLPVIVRFFLTMSFEGVQQLPSIRDYIDFMLNLLMCFGLIFELPILMVIITRFNLVKIETLKKNRKIVALLGFVVGALLTPPDVVSQFMMAIPIILLFEIGLLLSSVFKKRREAALDDAEAA